MYRGLFPLFVIACLSLCGCTGQTELGPDTSTTGVTTDTAATQKGMDESMKHMPPEMRKKMEARMGGAEKMKENATAPTAP